MAGLFEFGLQSDHLLHFQHGIPCGIQAHPNHQSAVVLRPGAGQRASAQQRQVRNRLRCEKCLYEFRQIVGGRPGAGVRDMTDARRSNCDSYRRQRLGPHEQSSH